MQRAIPQMQLGKRLLQATTQITRLSSSSGKNRLGQIRTSLLKFSTMKNSTQISTGILITRFKGIPAENEPFLFVQVTSQGVQFKETALLKCHLFMHSVIGIILTHRPSTASKFCNLYWSPYISSYYISIANQTSHLLVLTQWLHDYMVEHKTLDLTSPSPKMPIHSLSSLPSSPNDLL